MVHSLARDVGVDRIRTRERSIEKFYTEKQWKGTTNDTRNKKLKLVQTDED